MAKKSIKLKKKTVVLSVAQQKAIKEVIDYSESDERTHLEETLSEYGEEYEREMTDAELVKACKETGNTNHAWYRLHILSTILK